jgi:hypothetical protein
MEQRLQRRDSYQVVKPRILAGIALILLLRAAPAQAQFIGGSSFTGKDSLVSTWSDVGSAASVTVGGKGVNTPTLENLGGVVQLILKSSNACAFVTADYRWTMIAHSETHADGLCQVLYYRTFEPDEHQPYRFRWFAKVPYDIRTYVISNVSGIDVASNNSGRGTTLTANGVTTTQVGDYLMAFYANTGSGTWTQPSNMGIAVKNDFGYSGPATFRNLATQAWAYPPSPTGSKVATVSGRPVRWVADLVAFKPLYPIPAQTTGDINPGPVYNGCKGTVTLSAGAGTFTNSCVKTTSFCQCRDTTTIANSCTTANPSPGSVALKGTGTDVELVNCL